MVSLGCYVLTAMLIVSSFAHPSSNDDRSLEEWLHLQTEYSNLLNKITEDINGEDQFDLDVPEQEYEDKSVIFYDDFF